MLLLTLAVLAAAEPTVPDAPVSITEEDAPTVRLLTTGGTGGVGSGRYRFDTTLELASELSDESRSVRAFHGAMGLGRHLLLAEDRRAGSLVDFLEGSGQQCSNPQPWTAVETRHEVLLSRATLDGVGPSDTWRRWTCSNASGARALLVGPGDSEPPVEWSGAEFRLALHVRADGLEIDAVGLPRMEASRRVGELARILEEEPSVLYVDAGSFVDGTSSVRDGAPSLHRPGGFDALRRLGPVALAPGRTELAPGVGAFLAEAEGLPYVATNWEAMDSDMALPRSRIVEHEGLRVGFLGLLDPHLASWLPGLAEDGVMLGDPVEAARDELARMQAGHAVDLVVALTTARGDALETLRRELADVDLILGDGAGRTDRIEELRAELRTDAERFPALTLPLEGISLVEVELGDSGPSTVRVIPRPIRLTSQPDTRLRASIRDVRSKEYPPLDRDLLPAPSLPGAALSHGEWSKVVCEAVLQAGDAHVALLPELPQADPIPGPLSELLVVDRLAILDRLEVHEILGERLQPLLDKAYEVVPHTCGGEVGAKASKVGGRAIDTGRVYRVVTTDRLRMQGAIASMLQEGQSTRALDRPTTYALAGSDTDALTLRAGTLEVLRALRDQGDADPLQTLLARSPLDVDPLWLLRATHLAVMVESFAGVEDPAYESIPETLATSPSSLTLTTDADLALEYSSAKVGWDLRSRLTYTQLRTDAERSEPADDLLVSTSATLPAATLAIGSSGLRPYGEALLDSELTAVELDDGTTNPIQRDLSLAVGVSAAPVGSLKTLRVGGFALRDLSVPEKATEFGGRTEIATQVAFGPGLFWKSVIGGDLYANTPEPDTSDLRFKALLDTRVELPLARWLSGVFYGQAFAFAGRHPTTTSPATSWTVGSALDISGAFQL